VWGLTFLAVAIFASPAVLIDGPSRMRRPWLAPAIAAAVLIAMGAFGAIRLARLPTQFVADVKLRIMQPDLTQDARFNLLREGGRDAEISVVVGSLDRSAIHRRKRCDRADLARVRISVLSVPRTRRDGADRRPAAERAPC